MPAPIVFRLSPADTERLRGLLDLPTAAQRDLRPAVATATLLVLAAAVAWLCHVL